MPDRIYLDNAATTPPAPEAVEAMLRVLREDWGNASGVYATGREAHRVLDRARRQAAEALGADRGGIVFTSGGTESDNMALAGMALAKGPGAHIVTTAVEHEAVLNTCRFLEKQGVRVTYLPVDGDGLVDPDMAEKAITPDTALVSVMAANNEIGTLQPVAAICEAAHRHGVPFHTDAVQAAGILPLRVEETGFDLLSLSAHKFHGPKGAGILYVRKGLRPEPLLHGGQQERRMRSGTENTAAIAGMGEALALAEAGREEDARRVTALRERMIERLFREIPDIRLNGHRTLRLPGNVNISVRGVDGEAMLLRLDLAGIAASAGSACTSGSLEPSHVLTAIGLGEEEAKSAIRFSIGRQNTEADVDGAVTALADIVRDLRRMRGRA